VRATELLGAENLVRVQLDVFTASASKPRVGRLREDVSILERFAVLCAQRLLRHDKRLFVVLVRLSAVLLRVPGLHCLVL